MCQRDETYDNDLIYGIRKLRREAIANPLDPIQTEQIERGSNGLPAKTGLGVDRSETQIFKNATNIASSKLADTLNNIEGSGTWPIQVLMVVNLIGKPNGGIGP